MPNKQQESTNEKLTEARLADDMYRDSLEDDSGLIHPADGIDHDTDVVEGTLKNDAVLSGEFVSDLTTSQLLPEQDKNNAPSGSNNLSPDKIDDPSTPKMDANRS